MSMIIVKGGALYQLGMPKSSYNNIRRYEHMPMSDISAIRPSFFGRYMRKGACRTQPTTVCSCWRGNWILPPPRQTTLRSWMASTFIDVCEEVRKLVVLLICFLWDQLSFWIFTNVQMLLLYES